MSKDVHIGTIDNKKIYLMWQDVKDICNDEIKKENAKLKELLKECRPYITQAVSRNFYEDDVSLRDRQLNKDNLLTKIDEALK